MSICLCLYVCPSVCHTPVLSLNGYTYLQSFFRHPVAPILVFPYKTGWQYSDGDPLTRCRMQGGMKNHDFRPISRFISEMMQDRAIVTIEGE